MQVTVNATMVKITSSDIINQGEFNINTCNFTFSNEYDGLIKRAVFTNALGKNYLMEIENNMCIIPQEALALSGNITLGVYAYKSSGDTLVLRYSPESAKFQVKSGSFKRTTIIPAESAKDLYDKVNDLVAEVQTKIDNGDFDGVGIQSIVFNQDYTMTITLTDGTSATSQSLRGQQGPKGDKGDTYTITSNDYAEIAQIVLNQITIPTKTSELLNDSNFVNQTQLNNAIEVVNSSISGIQNELDSHKILIIEEN